MSEIFSPDSEYPSFAFADFIEQIRKNKKLLDLYNSIQVLRAERERKKISSIASEPAADKDDVPGLRLKLDAAKYLETNPSQLVGTVGAGMDNRVQAAVVLIPSKAPKGYRAQMLDAAAQQLLGEGADDE